VTYIIGSRLGPDVEARFLESLVRLDVVAPDPEDWLRIANLVGSTLTSPSAAPTPR